MPEYRSLTGHTYTSTKTGKETRVEIGDKIVGMNDTAAEYELEAGNIELIEAKKTVTKKGGSEDEHTT